MSSNLFSQTAEVSNVQPSFAKKALPAAIGIALSFAAVHEVAADTAGLQFYGRAHVSADFLDNGADSDLNVSSNSSRIGVRASTDLADGLKGLLQVESTISYDNGAGALANRDTFIGLQGGFGRVRLGQVDTPLKQIRNNVDFFGDQVGDLRNLTRLGGNAGAPYGQDFDARFRNGIYYNTNSFGGGFVFNFHYTPQVEAAPDLAGDTAAYSTSLVYNASGLYLSAAYEQLNVERRGATANDLVSDDSSSFRLGVRYQTGDWTFAGLFQQATVKASPTGSNPVVWVEGDEDITTVGIGASYKLSPEVLLKAQVYSLDADSDDRGATLLAVGADYILSRQFRLLFAYAATSNDDLATYRVTGGGGYGDGIATVPGETASGLSFGLRYDF